jgi:hypothetical protein
LGQRQIDRPVVEPDRGPRAEIGRQVARRGSRAAKMSIEFILAFLAFLQIAVLVFSTIFTVFQFQIGRQVGKTGETLNILVREQSEARKTSDGLLEKLGHLATSLDFVVTQAMRKS